jgi:uncharacterized membrane protein YhiD involved in acid resistance
MNKMQAFHDFLVGQTAELNVLTLSLSICIAIIMSMALSFIYIKFGHSLSNRRRFARNFVLLSLATLLVISIVKSSLALSLGLVGALSIVRFRSAIKEPEELVYLFLSIAIGLGLGAGQIKITVVAIGIIMVFVVVAGLFAEKKSDHNLYLSISSQKGEKISLGQLVEVLKKHCREATLKRLDESDEQLEALVLIDIDKLENLEKLKAELFQQSQTLKLSFMEK